VSRPLNMLAFDYGASSGRTVLGRFDGESLRLKEVHRFANEPQDMGDATVWDLPSLFRELKVGIQKGAAAASGGLSSIGIDTWGVDFGLLDGQGDLLANPYHYRGIHSHGMIEEALRRLPASEIHAITGVSFEQYNTLFQLLGLVIRKPDLIEHARTLLLMPDLLAYFLTGVRGTELTNASTTQLLSCKEREWSARILSAMGIPRRLFTAIERPFTTRGRLRAAISDALSVSPLPVVAVATHDTASAIAAVPLTGGGEAFVSSGTWSLFGIETDAPVINEDTLRWNTTNEIGAGGGYNLMKNIMGLWIIDECRRDWERAGLPHRFDEAEQAAAASPGLVRFVDPDDATFYRAGGMEEKVRRFCLDTGQSAPQTPGETARCVFESLALKYRWSIERLERLSGRPIGRLHVVGGGARSRFVNRCVASAIARPVVCGPVEATAIGNLLGQAIALGELRDLAQGRQLVARSLVGETHEPEETAPWDDAYGRFVAILEVRGGRRAAP
jgi:rhamnulokinase